MQADIGIEHGVQARGTSHGFGDLRLPRKQLQKVLVLGLAELETLSVMDAIKIEHENDPSPTRNKSSYIRFLGLDYDREVKTPQTLFGCISQTTNETKPFGSHQKACHFKQMSTVCFRSVFHCTRRTAKINTAGALHCRRSRTTISQTLFGAT